MPPLSPLRGRGLLLRLLRCSSKGKRERGTSLWLHVPWTCLAFAPEGEDSTWELDLRCQMLARSATWNTTSLEPEFWARVLKRAPWTTRLSGLIYSPSQVENGAASWMELLAASRASRIPMPGNDSENLTPETSGQSLQDWYSTLRRAGASSKTYQASLLTTGETYDPTYRPWVTKLRKESLARRKSALRTFGSDSSGWPAPTTAPEAPNSNSNKVDAPASLGAAARLWPTPRASTGGPENKNKATPRGGVTLHAAARGWFQEEENTVRLCLYRPCRWADAEEDIRARAIAQQGEYWSMLEAWEQEHPEEIAEHAPHWQTPTFWRTPNAGTPNSTRGRGQDPARRQAQGHQVMLQDQVTRWATPMASDGTKPSAGNRATSDLSHQGRATTMAGANGLEFIQILNPRFVEMLMGWPIGLTDYASSVTELSPWWQRMRCLLSRLGWD